MDCPKQACECGDESDWLNQFAFGVSYDFSCATGELNVRIDMTACDTFAVTLDGPNGSIGPIHEAGDVTISIPITVNGDYRLAIAARRYDENGDPCFGDVREFNFNIDCPVESCCGNENEFIETANEGFNITYVCSGFVGPRMTFSPNSAVTNCDRIIWKVIVEDETISEDTTYGDETLDLPTPNASQFRLQAIWERFDDNGESCFGFIMNNVDVQNACASLGPINVTLSKKSK